MSKPKLFVPFVLVLVASLLLTACAVPAPAPQAQTIEVTREVEKVVEVPAEPEVVTIEYWQYFFDPRVDAMNRLIQQFEAENPDVRVVHNSDIPYGDYRDKIAASVPAGVGPDVATLFYGWLPVWLDAGYLVPLPEDEFPLGVRRLGRGRREHPHRPLILHGAGRRLHNQHFRGGHCGSLDLACPGTDESSGARGRGRIEGNRPVSYAHGNRVKPRFGRPRPKVGNEHPQWDRFAGPVVDAIVVPQYDDLSEKLPGLLL